MRKTLTTHFMNLREFPLHILDRYCTVLYQVGCVYVHTHKIHKLTVFAQESMQIHTYMCVYMSTDGGVLGAMGLF
jgi:hypothetical protein